MIRSPHFLALCLLLSGCVASGAAFAQEKVRRNVEIEWEPVAGATLYEIQIQRKEDKSAKPTRFKTKESKWGATIKPGLYLMQIRSYDERGVPGSWPEPSELTVKLPAIIALEPKAESTIQAKDADTHRLDLKWEPVPGAAKYLVQIHSTSTDWSSQQEVREALWSPKVPVAQDYEWNVIPIDDQGEPGDKSETNYKVIVKGPMLKSPKLQRPLNKFVREVKWSAPDYTTHYSYELKYFSPSTRKWTSVESKQEHVEPELKMDISRPSGRYRLQVQAHGTKRDSSKKVQMDFETKGGFRDLASLESAELRETFNKPTNFYAIASYMITQVEYVGSVHEFNSRPKFSALGGTGRLGMGYQDPDSNWGGFGIVDLSGFVINGTNYKFASMEVHITRKLEVGHGGLILLGSGLFSKDLPVLRGSETTGFQGTGKVRNIGPHLGLLYWTPLNQRFGVQVNGRVYYTILGSGGNGQSTLPALSYQYGVLGSYRLSETLMGYAGYAHRTDESRYKADASDMVNGYAEPGDINTVTINGEYLNLLLEYSF